MKKVKKYWMVMVLGGLLMATLVGVAGARPNDAPQAAVTRRITVPASYFNPIQEGYDWYNAGYYIGMDSGAGHFYAPVVFPTGRAVVVESMTLIVYDNNASDNICVSLDKTYPGDPLKPEKCLGYVCSSGASTVGPLGFTTSGINYNPVKHGNGVYLHLQIEDDTDLEAYAVQIWYHNGTT